MCSRSKLSRTALEMGIMCSSISQVAWLLCRKRAYTSHKLILWIGCPVLPYSWIRISFGYVPDDVMITSSGDIVLQKCVIHMLPITLYRLIFYEVNFPLENNYLTWHITKSIYLFVMFLVIFLDKYYKFQVNLIQWCMYLMHSVSNEYFMTNFPDFVDESLSVTH